MPLVILSTVLAFLALLWVSLVASGFVALVAVLAAITSLILPFWIAAVSDGKPRSSVSARTHSESYETPTSVPTDRINDEDLGQRPERPGAILKLRELDFGLGNSLLLILGLCSGLGALYAFFVSDNWAGGGVLYTFAMCFLMGWDLRRR
jgi:hypothetical protein